MQKKGIRNIPKGAINYTLPKNTTTILKMSYKENTIWFIEWKKTNGSSELFFIFIIEAFISFLFPFRPCFRSSIAHHRRHE